MRDGTSYFRVRAAEVRAVGLQILDAKERKRILEIAESYDNLADMQHKRNGE